jgi:hypothetical protein
MVDDEYKEILVDLQPRSTPSLFRQITGSPNMPYIHFVGYVVLCSPLPVSFALSSVQLNLFEAL